MHLLYISQYYSPDITAAAFRATETVELLQQRGHQVRVITARPHRATVHSNECSKPETHVTRCGILKMRRGGALSYITHYLSFVATSLTAGIRLWFSGWRPDAVVATSPPLFVALVGVSLKALFRAPLILDIRDIWPESAIPAGQLTRGSLAYRLGRALERFVYSHATRLTCVSRPMAEYLKSESGKDAEVVYNGVLRNAVPSMTETQKDRSIVYAGNLGRVQALPELICAFASIVDTPALAGWRLRFVGTGVVEHELKTLASSLGLSDRVEFLGPMSKADALQVTQRAGLLYLGLAANPALSRTIPSKLFDYLATGRPIVGALRGEAEEVLEATAGNLCAGAPVPGAIAEALLRGVSNHQDLVTHSPRNRDLLLGRFTRESAVSVLESSIHRSVSTAQATTQRQAI